MADNILVTPGTGATVAADDIGGALHQRIKIVWGVDGAGVDASATNPLPVTVSNASVAVTGTFYQVTQPVSLASLPTLAAGTNNIGDVDVLTVPADPFGANADAASATGSISAKLRFIAGTGIPITGTVTVSAHAVTNAGVFVVQENGAALTSLQLIDDVIIADDAAFTPATTKVAMVGFTFDDVSPDSVNEGDGGAARMSANRNVYTQTRDAAGNERGANVDAGNRLQVRESLDEYETVAASQTAQALGATGATGDIITGVLVTPTTVSPGVVTLLDNATSIPLFAGGTNSLLTLHPFFIPLPGIKSVSGAWKLTTGAGLSCIAFGDFT